MKKLHKSLAAALLAALLLLACAAVPALAELPAVPTPEPGLVEAALSEAETFTDPAEPFTWKFLSTIPGAAGFALLVVEFLKAPLDKIWRIPTRIFAYFMALLAMLIGTAFDAGLTANTALLAAVNAILATMTAMGAYEVTFAKLETMKTK